MERYSQLCDHAAKDGRRCVLYLNHYGDHKEKHLKSSWKDEDEELLEGESDEN